MKMPKELATLLAGDRWERDGVGLSPARVYRLTAADGTGKTRYLKRIDSRYFPTTYSVLREARVLRWLCNTLRVPEVLYAGAEKEAGFLLLSELRGRPLSRMADCGPEEAGKLTDLLAQSVRLFAGVPAENCPFDSSLRMRLRELAYLLDSGLADADPAHWEPSCSFSSPASLCRWLCGNRPDEDPVFSHGDLTPANILLAPEGPAFLDLARAGRADRYCDIALCVREIRRHPQKERYLERFFSRLGLEPDWNKITYFTLLDELF